MQPISSFLSIILIIIFLLYTTSIIKSVSCSNDVLTIFYNNFVHTDFSHIVANLVSLYALSRVETKLSSKKFILLIIYLLIFNTVLETFANRLFNMPCTIGFSGVLFGILAFDSFAFNTIDTYLVLSIVLQVLLPSFTVKNVSFLGHAIGAFSGILAAVILKYLL